MLCASKCYSSIWSNEKSTENDEEKVDTFHLLISDRSKRSSWVSSLFLLQERGGGDQPERILLGQGRMTFPSELPVGNWFST